MKLKTNYSCIFVALVITVGSLIYGNMVWKNYSQVHHISMNTFEGDGAEQKASVEEMVDVFLTSPQVANNFKSPSNIQKVLIFNEFIDYENYILLETPPPNFFS